MKQILQNLKNGKTEIIELPAPQIKAGHVLIQTSRSLVSLGTERMLIRRLRRFSQIKYLTQRRKVAMKEDREENFGLNGKEK